MKTLFDDASYYKSTGGTTWKLENGQLFHRWGSVWILRSADKSQDEQILKGWIKMEDVKEIAYENAV